MVAWAEHMAAQITHTGGRYLLPRHMQEPVAVALHKTELAGRVKGLREAAEMIGIRLGVSLSKSIEADLRDRATRIERGEDA